MTEMARRVADLEKEIDELNRALVSLTCTLGATFGVDDDPELDRLRQALVDGKKIRPEIKTDAGAVTLKWRVGGNNATARIESVANVKGRGLVFTVKLLHGEVDVGHRMRQAHTVWEITGVEGSSQAKDVVGLVVRQVDGARVEQPNKLINSLLEKV